MSYYLHISSEIYRFSIKFIGNSAKKYDLTINNYILSDQIFRLAYSQQKGRDPKSCLFRVAQSLTLKSVFIPITPLKFRRSENQKLISLVSVGSYVPLELWNKAYRIVCITVRDSIYFLDFLGRIVFEFLPFFTK